MATKLEQLVHQPATWFSSTVEYRGNARAEFSNPKGWIEGEAICAYDELGVGTIEIIFTQWHNLEAIGEDDTFNLIWLAEGVKPDKLGDGIFSYGLNINTCNRIEIVTSEGVYSCDKVMDYTWQAHFESKVIFHPEQAEFLTTTIPALTSKYWAIPLLNFVSEFSDRSSNLNRHPLRIYPVQAAAENFLASDATDDEKGSVIHQLTARSYLLIFEYHGQVGFIERLPNYERHTVELRARERNIAQIAIMISEVNPTVDKLDPVEFLPVLSIATGNEVGAPWIEFRDENSKLTNRLHYHFGTPVFLRGRQALDNLRHKRGLSRLLYTATTSAYWGTTDLRVAMQNLAAGCISSRDFSVMLFYVCASLDILFRHFGLQDRVVFGLHNLTLAQREAVEKILRDAGDRMRGVKNKTTNDLEKRALDSIAGRVRSASSSKSGAFADKLVALLSLPQFNFKDMEAMEKYFATQSEGIEAWQNIVNLFRNQTAHGAFYPTATEELSRTLLHLHDILVRVILRMLNYDGPYAPTTLSSIHSEPLDWVQPDTSPRKLGYK